MNIGKVDLRLIKYLSFHTIFVPAHPSDLDESDVITLDVNNGNRKAARARRDVWLRHHF